MFLKDLAKFENKEIKFKPKLKLQFFSSRVNAKCLSMIFSELFNTLVVERWLVSGETKLEDSSGPIGRVNHRVVGQDHCRDAVLHRGELLQRYNEASNPKLAFIERGCS